MKIRPLEEKEIPDLAALAQTVYIDTFGDALSKKDLVSALDKRSEKYFRSILPKDEILAAEENGKIVGFIQFGQVKYDTIKHRETDIQLDKIYIHKNYQGRGIGKKLMNAMFAHNRLTDTEHIYLDVYEQNKKAISLYKKYGFEIVDKVPFEASGKVIGYDLLMKKVLNKRNK